jgi:hypothetical protein
MVNMKHLKLDEKASSDTRMALQMIKPGGRLFDKWFYRLLAESHSELHALQPELRSSTLFINATSRAGVADAFDTIVGQAHGAVERSKSVEAEKQQIDAQAKESAIECFKKSQGLSD